MAAGNRYDSPIKHEIDAVVRHSSSLSDELSENGLLEAVVSSSTGEFEGKHHFGLASASFGYGESQQLKTDAVCTDLHLHFQLKRGFQEHENLSNENRIKKLQLRRDLEARSIFGDVTGSIENAMTVDGNVIVRDAGKMKDRYEVDGSDTGSLKIKLIDDTAVIEPFSGYQKKAIRPRRKGKGVRKAKMVFQYRGDGAKAMYSRGELLAMRIVGVVKQKRLWREIYDGLGSVAEEYASLVGLKNPKPRNPLEPSILGPISESGRSNPFNLVVHPNIIPLPPFCASNWP